MMAKASISQLRYLGTVLAVLLFGAVLLFVSTIHAAEGRRPAKLGDYNPNDETVEMFSAIDKGDIGVKLIPKDSSLCRVLIENKTDRPLNVKLPSTFAGVPALAQIGAGARSTRSGSSGNSSSQSMGGGMGGMGMGGMGGGGGGGFFNVPPEKVGKFEVTTVCLEHGKDEPRAAIPYEIKPLESFTNKTGVRELCELLGSGNINQRAAQVAAWHLNNDMSWQTLAAKQLRFANGTRQPYFTAEEIQGGMNLVSTAVRTAEERKQENVQQPSPGESLYQPSQND